MFRQAVLGNQHSLRQFGFLLFPVAPSASQPSQQKIYCEFFYSARITFRYNHNVFVLTLGILL